jgi:2-polyprenyl-3-methyl-5-hydroxy-6-metoxy-1,4-benzoquinol methylase
MYVSNVTEADTQHARSLYGRNAARPKRSFAARLDEYLQARQRRAIVAAAQFAPGLQVIDVGAGQGTLCRAARQAGAQVTAVDVVPQLVEQLKSIAHTAVLGDVESLSAQQTYDRVLFIGVLDFVVKPAAALQKLASLVAPGGRLLLLVPTQSPGGAFYRFEKWLKGVKVNLYRPRWCVDCLTAAGLQLRQQIRPLPSNCLMVFERPAADPEATAAA